jgi:hypothetical protein
MKRITRIAAIFAIVVMCGCADIRPNNLDKVQRDVVSEQLQKSMSTGEYSITKDEGVLIVIDKRGLLGFKTTISTFGSVKNDDGNSISTMNGLINKSYLNVPPGVYSVFITCQAPGLYNNHLVKINVLAGSSNVIFCMPRIGKLLGLDAFSGFYVFVADANRFEELQSRYRREIEAGVPMSCGENCHELPID